MAIIGPAELPQILRVPDNPIKKYVLSMLGHPVTEVEIEESQWNTIFNVSGDFIAHYFPLESRLTWFYTNPLQTDYEMPDGAYWIRSVKWDPATTNIGDVFGAESFLFCFADGLKILNDNNELIPLEDWKENYKAKTPFGNCKLSTIRHKELQRLIKVEYTGGSIVCTPNHPIKISGLSDMLNDWTPAEDLKKGMILSDKKLKVKLITEMPLGPTTTVCAKKARCFYGCFNGEPILVH